MRSFKFEDVILFIISLTASIVMLFMMFTVNDGEAELEFLLGTLITSLICISLTAETVSTVFTSLKKIAKKSKGVSFTAETVFASLEKIAKKSKELLTVIYKKILEIDLTLREDFAFKNYADYGCYIHSVKQYMFYL